MSLSGSSSSFPASGGTGSLTVTTTRNCTWTATADAAWVALSGTINGQGDGTVGFSVAANSAVAARSANIAVNGQTFSLSEQAAPCSFSVTPTVISIAAPGGTASVSVQAQSGCAWTAASDATWVSISSGNTGSGAGSVQLVVAPNTASARSATVTVAGQTVNVSQAGVAPPAPCVFSIAPTNEAFGAGGGNGAVTVATGSGCAWTATSPVPWVTITAGTSGAGNGIVTFAVDVNSGAARSATLAIAGQAFGINQSAGAGPPPACSFSISPLVQAFPATGGSGAISVQTSSGCSWTATSGAQWVTIMSGASGTGSGSVAFSVAPNTGPARSTTLTIAGQAFTVNQDAAPCAYSVSPQSATVGAAGGPGILTFAVSTTAGCPWTAVSNVAWMSIDSGAAGTGPGSVVVSVAQNTGAAQQGTLTVAGQTITVSQAAAATGNVAGLVAGLAGACPTVSFLVMTVQVEANAATAYAGGSCLILVNGVAVGVQGFVQPDASLLATLVTIQRN